MAKKLNNLLLLRAEPAEAFLIVAGELAVGGFFEGADEVVEGLFGQKLGEDEVDARVPTSEIMDGLDSGVAGGGLEKSGEFFIAVDSGDVGEELDGVFDI